MPEPTDLASSFQLALKVAFELHNAGRHADAEAICRVLLPINPRDGQLLFLLGMILQKTGKSAEALKYLESAALLPPPSARIFNALGFVHYGLKNHARAVEHYAKALALGWQAADTFYGMGNACYQLGEVERAASLFQKAVELQPRDAPSWNNLGKCLADSGRLEESIQAFDHAIAADPDYVLARYGRALTLLTAGRLNEGFPEYNQWRYYRIPRREFPQPAWTGQAIPGQTLFLHAEQGFGDAIQWVRLIRQARERVGKVILECRPELKTLFIHSGCADVVIAYGELIPPFDYFTSLASLAGILEVTLSTIPREVPYLKPGAGTLPPPPPGHLKVGLAWAGNPLHHNNRARSLRLKDLAPLRSLPDVTFYSLQISMPAPDEAGLPSWPNLVDLRGSAKDFLETSAVVAQLDLVISVDTAMAHLAGALAKPVWTLLPYAPDWRWFLNRNDSPWYPTMQLFRQTQRNQWSSVILRVAEELRRLRGLSDVSSRRAIP